MCGSSDGSPGPVATMPIIRAWGSNLSLLLAERSDADFDRAIRYAQALDVQHVHIMAGRAEGQACPSHWSASAGEGCWQHAGSGHVEVRR